MDFNWLLIFSMGISMAKTDLNSHQFISEPGFFAETDVLMHTSTNGHIGMRATYYYQNLPVRESFEVFAGGENHLLRELVLSPYMGFNYKLSNNLRFYIDVGPQWQWGHKMGLGGRAALHKTVKIAKGKYMMIGLKSGLDYWMFDTLDNYIDETDYQGDILTNFSFSTAIPLN